MFLKQMEVGQLGVFAYIIGCLQTHEALVVDPADEIDKLLAICQEHQFKIKYIVNTHCHVDHVMGNKEMKEKTGALIIIHELDAPYLDKTPLGILNMFGASQSPPADLTVTEGDYIEVGELKLKVLHTPGHSGGGMCLHINNYVLTGDSLFVGGVGRVDLPGGSWDVLFHSIRTKLLVLPDETIVLPGHNYGYAPTSTIGQEKRQNPFLVS